MLQRILEAQKFFRKLAQENNGAVKGDLSVDSQHAAMVDYFGGHQFLERQYPAIRKMLEKTRKHHVLKKRLQRSEAAKNRPAIGLQDHFDISISAGSRPCVFATANYAANKSAIIVESTLKELSSDTFICGSNAILQQNHLLKNETSLAGPMKGDLKEYHFEAVTSFKSFEKDDSGHDALINTTRSMRASYIPWLDNYVKSIEVYDPAKKITTSPDQIKVNYAGGYGSDYNLNVRAQIRTDRYGHKTVPVHLPVSGKAIFDDKLVVTKVIQSSNFCSLTGDIVHGAIYNNSNWNDIKLTLNGNEMSWLFNQDWKNAMVTNTTYCQSMIMSFKLQLSVELQMKSSALASPLTATIVVGSGEAETDQNHKKIPSLYFYWDCFGAATLIRKANGDEAPVAELAVGDTVWAGQNQFAKVIGNVRRTADEMVSVQVNGKEPLLLTPDHPVFTGRGMMPAYALTVGDMLRDYKNELVAITRLENISSYTGPVYSVQIEPAGLLLANGLVVGDFEAQWDAALRHPVEAPAPAEPLAPELAHELEQWSKMRNSLMFETFAGG